MRGSGVFPAQETAGSGCDQGTRLFWGKILGNLSLHHRAPPFHPPEELIAFNWAYSTRKISTDAHVCRESKGYAYEYEGYVSPLMGGVTMADWGIPQSAMVALLAGILPAATPVTAVFHPVPPAGGPH